VHDALSKIDIKAADNNMIRFCVLTVYQNTTNCMINGINFYSKVYIGIVRIFSRVHLFRQKVDDVFKVDYILEFLKKTLLF